MCAADRALDFSARLACSAALQSKGAQSGDTAPTAEACRRLTAESERLTSVLLAPIKEVVL
jgi:hypothetical protein